MSQALQEPESVEEDTVEDSQDSNYVQDIAEASQSVQINQKRTDIGNPNKKVKCLKIHKTKSKNDLRQLKIEASHTSKSPNSKEDSLSSNSNQQDPWKADNEFSKDITKWNNYFLIPNPKSTAKNFQCGSCKCIFLKIVEFTHHCFSICGQIYNFQSSHFIISDSMMSNTLYKNIINGQMSVIEEQMKSIRKRSLRRKKNGRFALARNLDHRSKSQIKPIQLKLKKPNTDFHHLQLTKNKQFVEKQLMQNTQKRLARTIRYAKGKSIAKQDASQTQYQYNNDHNHELSKPKKKFINVLSLPEQKLREFIEQKTEKIKRQSKTIIEIWKKNRLETDFIMHDNYQQFYPSFVFVLNPLKNIVNLITDECEKCQRKFWKMNHRMADHFLGRCCEINTQESTYLILWSQYFYQYLYERNENHYKTNLDIAYWKYLYQKTPLTDTIDTIYPKFKYYLGYIHCYIFTHSIIGVCKFCKFVRPAEFISASKPRHKASCILMKDNKRDFIRLSRENNHRFLNKELLNVEMIQEYTFFCPCKSYEEQFGVQELIEHLQAEHPDKIFLYLQIVFQKHQQQK